MSEDSRVPGSTGESREPRKDSQKEETLWGEGFVTVRKNFSFSQNENISLKKKKVQKHKEKLFAFFFRVYNNYYSCILFSLIKIFHYTKIQQRTTLLKYWMHLDLLFLFFFISTLCLHAQQCSSTLCDPMDCSPPGSSVHGILQARILEWVAVSFSRGSSQLRDRTRISYFLHCRRILYGSHGECLT